MRAAVLFVGLILTAGSLFAADPWPQFRGPHSSGISASSDPLPTEIGPGKNELWKVSLPPGHSSPIISGDRIFLTAVRDGKLLTMGLDLATGKVLWEVEAPHGKLETIHSIGSHVQPTPATDGHRVVSFFGSSGLFCYDRDGKQLWHRPMGPFNNDFGAGSSPIIEDDRVILCQDHDTDSFLMALDKQTGQTIWTADRAEFPRNYCTPIIWNNDGKKQIVVAATLRVAGYDFASGRELWTVRGISRTVCMTPVVGADGTLYVAGWAAGGDAGEPIRFEPFADAINQFDADKSGTLEDSELPKGPVKQRYSQIDRDKSGKITEAEYEYFRGLFAQGKNLVVAIKPGGAGEITDTHVAWRYAKFVPFCASPLAYEGNIFTIKDGGILSCLDAQTGKPSKQQRIAATDDYYASPVAGDGKVYLINQLGVVTVINASPKWEVQATAEFGEEVYATPAIADGKIYVRTVGHLYCFGK